MATIKGLVHQASDRVSTASNLVSASLAPVDTHGGSLTPPPGILAQGITSTQAVLRLLSVLSPSDVPAVLDLLNVLRGRGMNDRLYLLEKVLTLMANLPTGSTTSKELQGLFIDFLYKDLAHPPDAYLAPFPTIQPDARAERGYHYRSTNGDNYAPDFPLLGRAGLPYSRSVPAACTAPPSSLPDPGLVFDLLLSRPAHKFTPHPGGLSALFFGMANLIIHSVFDTRRGGDINDTSSYVDLSPLYGNTVSKQSAPPDALRRLDGTGRLHEDVFADSRLLFMPPASAALLVLMCRNHNYLAEKIRLINENGTYQDFPPDSEEAVRAQDDEIYERSRLVNCAVFARVVLYDYVGGILGLTRDGNAFRLDLVQEIRRASHSIAPLGEGNQISAEFNLVYRWHASTSQPDDDWTQEVFDKILPGTPYNQVTPEEFIQAAGQYMRPNDPDPKKWEFGGLKRDPVTLRFNDAELAKIIKDATETPASSFGARNIPEVFRVIEILTIQEGRKWGMCTLNECRRFFGLRPYANFKEWNPDPEICNAAQSLYGSIDRLELHVGLQAEDTKKPMPGAGLCPSYTISRAILADAIVLVRSDPYLSTEFNPRNCTAWAYQDCDLHPDDGSYGGGLTRLLLRHLPGQYSSGDAYVHFPFLVPNDVRKTMLIRRDPVVDKYNWKRPVDPNDPEGPQTPDLPYDQQRDLRIAKIVHKHKINRGLVNHWLSKKFAQPEITEIFADLSRRLIIESSIVRPGFNSKKVDIVQTVINLVPVYFAANHLLGLPLKTEDNPRGVYRPENLYDSFANTADYVLYDRNPPEEWRMREKATDCANTVIREVHANFDRVSCGIFSIRGFVDAFTDLITSKENFSDKGLVLLLKAARQHAMSHGDIAASLFAVIIPSLVQWSSVVSELLNLLLTKRCTILTEEPMLTATDGEDLPAKAGFDDTDGTNISSSTLTPKELLKLARKIGAFDPVICGDGLMAPPIFAKTASIVLRHILDLRGIERTPDAAGELRKFTQTINGQEETFFINRDSALGPWPTNMMVQYQP